MRPGLLLIAAVLLLAGCGYRAPLHASYIPEVTDTTRYAGVRADYQQLAALMEKDTGLEPTGGNAVALLPDVQVKWQAMMGDIASAEESVYMDYYRFLADSTGSALAHALKDRAVQGADVRLILDKYAGSKADRDSLERLFAGDVKLGWFRAPVSLLDYVWPEISTHRDHRKILLMDGNTGYIGGRNIADKYYTHWRDADMRITGPAVDHLSMVFKHDQDKVAPEMGPLKPAGGTVSLDAVPGKAERVCCDTIPGLEQRRDATVQIVYDDPTDRLLPVRNCFEWAIGHARRYFWFYNPYTPPPASTLRALKEAAARGVDVRWIAPSVNDVAPEKWMGESLYRELLSAGVHIYEWEGDYLHAKELVSDDYLTVNGSANMDNLSFFLNYEVLAIVYDRETALSAAATFRSDIADHCREITLDEVLRWGFLRHLRNWITRTLAGHLG